MTLPKTEKLYLDEPYKASFHAQIVGIRPLEKTGTTAVVLDHSCFFPESGGQLPDRGTIGDLTVVDVQEAPGGVVLHYVEGEVGAEKYAVGSGVECTVDWKRRFDHMQQHTGQHVLSRAFIEVADLHTESFHMGEDACTIDLAGNRFDDEAAADAEKLANSIVLQDRPVNVRNTSPDEQESLDLRKAAPEGVTDVRLVEVDGFDLNPCCGTHVRSTGEIGLIKILKAENVKGTKRVQFKAGARAFEDYKIKHDILQQLANRFTTSVGDVGAKVDKMSTELRQSKKRIKQLEKNLAAFQVAEMMESARDHGGIKLVVRHFADGDADFLRQLSAGLKSQGGTVAILGAGDGSVLCSASDGIDVDFSENAVAMAVAAGGSGGGKGAFAQLKLPGGVDVENFLKKVGDNVKTVL